MAVSRRPSSTTGTSDAYSSIKRPCEPLLIIDMIYQGMYDLVVPDDESTEHESKGRPYFYDGLSDLRRP